MGKKVDYTKDQLAYARHRLDQMHAAKKYALDQKFITPPKVLTGLGFVTGIKTGKIKPHSHIDLSQPVGYHYGNFFDLNGLTGGSVLRIEDPDYQARSKALRDGYTKAMDELMLGDFTKAMAAIEAFAKVTG